MRACAARAPCPPSTPRRRTVVAAAGKRGGGGGGKRGSGGGGKQQKPRRDEPATTHRSKTGAMTEFKADEVLMFDPVPAERGALQARARGARAAGSSAPACRRLAPGSAVFGLPPPCPLSIFIIFTQVMYAFPNEYTVGITSLGYQLVWAFFETRPDVAGAPPLLRWPLPCCAGRAWGWPGVAGGRMMQSACRSAGPRFAHAPTRAGRRRAPTPPLSSAVARLFTDAHDPLPAATDLLGFSFSWELDYANILRCLACWLADYCCLLLDGQPCGGCRCRRRHLPVPSKPPRLPAHSAHPRAC